MKTIKSIGFENFRVFKNRSVFELAPFTILTGANSSGKSTFIKALKLLQEFWAQKKFGHELRFSEGNVNHQLGNFDMSISKNGQKKEMVFSYKINHIVFNELNILLYFENSNNKLNDGVLTKTEITLADGTVLFSVLFKDNCSVFLFDNYKFILNKLIPAILTLEKEFHSYEKKGKLGALFMRDLFEIDGTDLATAIHDPKQYCEERGIDYERSRELFYLFVCEFVDERHNKIVSTADLKSFLDLNYIYDSEFISIFADIPVSEYVLFAEKLWNRIVTRYPDAAKKFTVLTFKEYLESSNIGDWVDNLIVSGHSTFHDFYTANLKTAIDIVSRNYNSQGINIEDQAAYGGRFYEPLIIGTNSIFDFTLNHFQDQESLLSPEEQSLSICTNIIRDAKALENKILNRKLDFFVDSILISIKQFIKEITYSSIRDAFDNLHFVNSIRASSQRFYAFSSHDSDFHSFISEFLRRKYSPKEYDFIKNWIKYFEIADDVKLDLIEGAGSQVFLIKGKEEINLVDLGYGVTQFLPILLQIVYCNNINKKIVVIEEPETNLHPKLQSKLADLFLAAYREFEMEFIIETHSEYLIRKLQYLTAKGAVESDETVIHYIGSSDENLRDINEEQIRTIRIKPNGQLTKPFGSGFTDESSHWIKEMFFYHNQN